MSIICRHGWVCLRGLEFWIWDAVLAVRLATSADLLVRQSLIFDFFVVDCEVTTLQLITSIHRLEHGWYYSQRISSEQVWLVIISLVQT